MIHDTDSGAAGTLATTSIANLAHEEWTIANLDHPTVVTCALWLDSALESHTAALKEVTDRPVRVEYRIDGADIDDAVQQVRSVMAWLHEAYRQAKTYDVTTRPDRYALLQRLAEERVMPSEMALMLDVDLTIAERFAGADVEARLARTILHQLRSAPRHDEGARTE